MINQTVSQLSNEYQDLLPKIRQLDQVETQKQISALLCDPMIQGSLFSVEALQTLVFYYASGRVRPTDRTLNELIKEIRSRIAGRLEDPVEDAFTSLIHFGKSDYVIFEGLSEGNAYTLQRFVESITYCNDIAETYLIRDTIHSALILSNEIAKRFDLPPFTNISQYPVEHFPVGTIRKSRVKKHKVYFSWKQIKQLGINPDCLEPIVHYTRSQINPGDSDINDTIIDRAPIARDATGVIVVKPSAIGTALKWFILTMFADCSQIRELQRAVSRSFITDAKKNKLFSAMWFAGGEFEDQGPYQTFVFAQNVDELRYIIYMFMVDDFSDHTETGFTGVSGKTDLMEHVVAHNSDFVFNDIKKKSPDAVVTLFLSVFSFGRPLALDLSGRLPDSLRFLHVPPHDLATLGRHPKFSNLSVLNVLSIEEKMYQSNIRIFNPNGFINMFAWLQQSGDQFLASPFGESYKNAPLNTVVAPSNAQLSLRTHVYNMNYPHHVNTPDGEALLVEGNVREELFEDLDRQREFFVFKDIEERRLRSLYESEQHLWWCAVSSVDGGDAGDLFRFWEMLFVWLKRTVPRIERRMRKTASTIIGWHLRLPAILSEQYRDQSTPAQHSVDYKNFISHVNRSGWIEISVEGGFVPAFEEITNIAERLIIEEFVRQTFSSLNVEVSENIINEVLWEVFPNRFAKQVHFVRASTFRDMMAGKIVRTVTKISNEYSVYSKIGIAWNSNIQNKESCIQGIPSCAEALNSVVEVQKDLLKSYIRSFSKSRLLHVLLETHEAAAVENDRWLRTARAVLALQGRRDQTSAVAAKEMASHNGVMVGARLLCELVCAEGVETYDRSPGDIDVGRLLALIMHVVHVAGTSDAIVYGVKEPRVEVSFIGDILTDHSFEDDIVNPYGEHLGSMRFSHGAARYEKNFAEITEPKPLEEIFDFEFLAAWDEEFGYNIDELFAVVRACEGIGFDADQVSVETTIDELLEYCRKEDLLYGRAQLIIKDLTLFERESLEAVRPPYGPKDWYPWRTRRWLSLVVKPIISLNAAEGRILFCPMIVMNAAMKRIDYCLEGGFPAETFKTRRMRKWVGHIENKNGHEFNRQVRESIDELVEYAQEDMKLTEILNMKINIDYGDVDVFIVKGSIVYVVECKALERALMPGEIGRQVSTFLGRQKANGKPDRLLKHLKRAEILEAHRDRLATRFGLKRSFKILPVLVFSEVVPLHFSREVKQKGVPVYTVDEFRACLSS